MGIIYFKRPDNLITELSNMSILHVSINSTEQSAVIILGTLIIFWLFYKLKNRIIYRLRSLENHEIIYKFIHYSFLSSLIMTLYLKKIFRQPTEWEKIFANSATNKGLISKNHKQLKQIKYQKNKQPNQKIGRRPT